MRAVCADHFVEHKETSFYGTTASSRNRRRRFPEINLIRHLMARGYALALLDVEEFDYPERTASR